MAALTDLAGALDMMTPAKRKQALHHILERVDFDADGELCRVTLREWMRQAMMLMAPAWRECYGDYASIAPGEQSPHDWRGVDQFMRLAA